MPFLADRWGLQTALFVAGGTCLTMRHYADAGDLDEQRQQLIGRLIEPAEIAEAVAFLAGPASGAIVGASLIVDGGYTIH